MKILALMNQPSGVDYHRLIKPLTRLHIDTGTDVSKAQDIVKNGVPPLGNYDLVVFNRYLYKPHSDLIAYMGKYNIPYVIDIDDYWKPVHHHPAHKFYGIHGVTKAIEEAIRYASGVTVSTEALAALVRPLNPRVKILPNALDTTDEQWNQPHVPSDIVRIGWLAGATHHNDASIIGPAISMAMREAEFEFVYCGYAETKINESILFRLNDGSKKQKIKVMNGMRPDQYGAMLSRLDVVVAPLEDVKYNRCKSDIKIQEAAAYGLPIICSDVTPYSEHSINPGVTLVPNTTSAWAEALIWYAGNNTKAPGHSNEQYCSKYDIEEINKKRLEFYEQCVKSSTHVRG